MQPGWDCLNRSFQTLLSAVIWYGMQLGSLTLHLAFCSFTLLSLAGDEKGKQFTSTSVQFLFFLPSQKKTMFTCMDWSGWVVWPSEQQVDQTELVEPRLDFWMGPSFSPSNAFPSGDTTDPVMENYWFRAVRVLFSIKFYCGQDDLMLLSD